MRALVFAVTALVTVTSAADDVRREATDATRAANAAVRDALPFADDEDFALAERGFIATTEDQALFNAAGEIVWSFDRTVLGEDEGPATVNPSLWRQARLNAQHGLYEVTGGIYQVRGFDLSNMSIIEGDTGYIVVDPLITREVARAAMDLVYAHLPEKPVVAVVYSHSHADHFGGVRGVVSQEQVDAGEVRIIAPNGFMEYAVSENVLAGNAMSRRASYMYGSLLARDARGAIDSGLGRAISNGVITLISPTETIMQTDQELVIDGVRFVFMNTPHAEAPAEMMFYLPDRKAFYAAEEANGTLHNLYTLRGAQVRDALLWSGYLAEAIDFIEPETAVLFGGHHWPRWGYDHIVDYLTRQGDAYKYIHDQTLRLANHGYTMDEISERLHLPPSLAKAWYNRDYYGTVSHNARAVYQKYLGFFDGNPANIQPLPPEEVAAKYVSFMGGADAVLEKARRAYEDADYRWVVEVVNHVVFADSGNDEARQLQADALEQLGYQAESGPWRNFYLTGARELRSGVSRALETRTISPDMIKALSLADVFDFLAVRLNGPAAVGQELRINFLFPQSGDSYRVRLANGVLRYAPGRSDQADVTVESTREGLLAMMMLGRPIPGLIEAGLVRVEGDVSRLEGFIALLDNFEFWFDIVTP